MKFLITKRFASVLLSALVFTLAAGCGGGRLGPGAERVLGRRANVGAARGRRADRRDGQQPEHRRSVRVHGRGHGSSPHGAGLVTSYLLKMRFRRRIAFYTTKRSVWLSRVARPSASVRQGSASRRCGILNRRSGSRR